MNLVTVHSDTFIAAVCDADLGYATLNVEPKVKPRILPCRRLLVANRDKVKTELDSLVDKAVIPPVTEPTERVSQIAVVNKKKRLTSHLHRSSMS